jgi:hypothetical protein
VLASVASFFRQISLSPLWFLAVDLFLVVGIALIAKNLLAFIAPLLVFAFLGAALLSSALCCGLAGCCTKRRFV